MQQALDMAIAERIARDSTIIDLTRRLLDASDVVVQDAVGEALMGVRDWLMLNGPEGVESAVDYHRRVTVDLLAFRAVLLTEIMRSHEVRRGTRAVPK